MKLLKKYPLIFFSAVMYAFSFMPNCWVLSFLFLIPLFFVALKTQLSFLDGFVWGIIAFCIHLYGAFTAIDTMVQGSLFLKLALPALAFVYLSFFSGIWFVVAQFFSHRIKNNLLFKLLIWTLSSWLFFIFLDGYILAPFGKVEGCLLLNPLLPLVQVPSLLGLLSVLGEGLLLLLLMLVPASIVFCFVEKNYTTKVFLFFSLLPWILSFIFFNRTIEQPAWLAKVSPLAMQVESSLETTRQMQQIRQAIEFLATQNKKLELVIMPESAVYSDVLTKRPQACALINSQQVKKEIKIALGSFRWHKKKFCNSFFFLKNGQIQEVFDKRHAMVLTERLPTFLNNERLYKAFYSALPPISPSQNKRPKVELIKNIFFVPYICSELFFNQYPDDVYHETILATCNDKWCSQTNIPFLMFCMAQFRAIGWSRDILYVSYRYASYISKWGSLFYLTD